jgi:hypothetical protein
MSTTFLEARLNAIYFQSMQQRFHLASLRAIEANELATARVFQRKSAECHIVSVRCRDAMRLTVAGKRRSD